MAQILISLVILCALVGLTYFLYIRRRNQVSDVEDLYVETPETVLHDIKNEISDATRDTEHILTNDVNYDIMMRNKIRIDDALIESVYGIPAACNVVIALIRDILENRYETKEQVCNIINWEDYINLEPIYLFWVLVYKLNKIHRKKTLQYLISTYPELIELKEKHEFTYDDMGNEIDDTVFRIREFDAVDLTSVFMAELDNMRTSEEEFVTFEECLDLFAQVEFSLFRGNRELHPLLQLTFDGMHFGTSGSIRYEIDGVDDCHYKTTNSVWIQVDAKWVLLSFIDLRSVGKMRQIINQLVSYGSAAPMTEKNPKKVCDGWDGSRRVAIRPPAGESWFFTMRNFTLSIYKLQALLDKKYVRNWKLPAKLIEYLMKAEETTAFTGQQNTGKTTLMKSAVEFMEDKNIRVLEMAFELALREIYKHKDIFTVKPTDYVSSAELQDILKKTDGWVSMVGEVAEDIVAARMIQFCLIASAFTIFSHHGRDDNGLVSGLTNSLVASGEYHDHAVAMSTVLEAIKNNVHLGFTENKERILEYISLITKEDELQPYPEIVDLMEKAKLALKRQNTNVLAECMVAYMMLNREYYTRSTDRVRFTSRKIVVYNPDTKAYEPNEWYTPEAMERILNKLNEKDRREFIQFYLNNWVNKQYGEDGVYTYVD